MFFAERQFHGVELTMETSRPAQSRLLLRLAQVIADSNYPISAAKQRRDNTPRDDREERLWGQGGKPARAVPDSGWERIDALGARFRFELVFAEGFLKDEPPASRVETLLANSSELRKAAILQRFVDRAYGLRLHDPQKGLEISEDLIAWTPDPSPLVAAVRCRALMERANFLRALGERERAYAALAIASEELEARGITDPLEWARFQEIQGTLESYCGNTEAAVRLLRKALAKVRRWGDKHTLQRVLIAAALTELLNRNFEPAEDLLDEAMGIEEPDRFLLQCAATNRVLAYVMKGNPQEAYRKLLGIRAAVGPSWLGGYPSYARMRQIWLEGQILNQLHMNEDAIGLLRDARDYYIQTGCGYEVCYISVDLALAHAAQRRFAEVRRELALALMFCSEERALDRHGKEAVLLLQRGMEQQGRLEPEKIRAVASRLAWMHRAPLRTFSHPPFAELQI